MEVERELFVEPLRSSAGASIADLRAGCQSRANLGKRCPRHGAGVAEALSGGPDVVRLLRSALAVSLAARLEALAIFF